jgi:hypothetical protein
MKTFAKMVKGLCVILVLVCFCVLIFGQPIAFANDQYEKRLDQIDEALREGRMSLKIVVLQKARILYSPHRDLLKGEEIGDETPRLELFEDVRRVFEELTIKEKSSLRSLSPELARVIDEEESGGQLQKAPIPQRILTAFNRVAKAYDHGEISLKEAVFLKAQLLFVPQTIEAHHPFSFQTGEVPAQEECLTGFYTDVHRVFDQLTVGEIVFLKSLSPDLKVIMTAREQERSGTIDPSRTSALPDYPNLDQTEEGTDCIVHYTLTGTDAVPNKAYAELVTLYMDTAIKIMTKDFPTAYAEGYADFKGKMHVYILLLAEGINGAAVPVSTVSGKKNAMYIKISNFLNIEYRETWQLKLKGLCFHEYLHAIQLSYNAYADNWFLEAGAVWASCYYGADWTHVGEYYISTSSVFNKPNDILWSTDYRRYSTSALAFYLSDKFGGYNFIKAWMLNTETEDDKLKTLQQTLIAKDTVFEEEYIYFLASLYGKSIKSIKKYMPDVKIEWTHDTYGREDFGVVHLTGANFYVFNPEAGAKAGTFIATFTAGATGAPKGVLVPMKGKKTGAPIAFTPHISGSPTAYVGKFGKAIKQIALIVTDATYSTKDTVLRDYDYTAIVPNIYIREVIAESPIYAGDVSYIDVHYDLTGTIPGEFFPAFVKVVEKGPGVADNVSGDEYLYPGVDQIYPIDFQTASYSHGTYKFVFEMAVPPEAWLPIPQVKTKGKCSVRVEEWSWGNAARQTTTKEIDRPALTIRK